MFFYPVNLFFEDNGNTVDILLVLRSLLFFNVKDHFERRLHLNEKYDVKYDFPWVADVSDWSIVLIYLPLLLRMIAREQFGRTVCSHVWGDIINMEELTTTSVFLEFFDFCLAFIMVGLDSHFSLSLGMCI